MDPDGTDHVSKALFCLLHFISQPHSPPPLQCYLSFLNPDCSLPLSITLAVPQHILLSRLLGTPINCSPLSSWDLEHIRTLPFFRCVGLEPKEGSKRLEGIMKLCFSPGYHSVFLFIATILPISCLTKCHLAPAWRSPAGGDSPGLVNTQNTCGVVFSEQCVPLWGRSFPSQTGLLGSDTQWPWAIFPQIHKMSPNWLLNKHSAHIWKSRQSFP